MLKPQRQVTQESLLLDAAERSSRQSLGGEVAWLNLSRLRPQNRTPARLRIVSRMFDGLTNTHRCHVFGLHNGDLVIFNIDAPMGRVDQLIDKVRRLFSNDPLTFVKDQEGNDRFLERYDLNREFHAFFQRAETMEKAVDSKDTAAVDSIPPPLTPKELDAALSEIDMLDLAPLVRRQAAVRVGTSPKAEVLFQEFFVAMAELKPAVAPGRDILADRWMFQHMSETLDQRMLTVLRKLNLCQEPTVLSLNLNLATVLTPRFQEFVKAMKPDQALVVEVQLIDVFTNPRSYDRARSWLRDRGHRILIDSMTPLTLECVQPALLDADLYKLMWSPEMGEPGDTAAKEAKAMVADLGAGRVILARCETEDAIRWGMGEGINSFQGQFIDAMMGAVTMAACWKKEEGGCSLGRCITRRGMVAGAERDACPAPENLDSEPPIATPGRKRS